MTAQTFTAEAHIRNGQFYGVSFVAEFDSMDNAKNLVSSMPKFIKAKSCPRYGVDRCTFAVWLMVDLTSNQVTGEMNEMGLKRLRAFAKRVNWEYSQDLKSNPVLREQVEAAIVG